MHHLIFEGAELSGKSWLMSQIYDRLEAKYNGSKNVLDGCHWFNCDVGVYGTELGGKIINRYLGIFEDLKEKNLLVEKFHLADIINNRLHRGVELNYAAEEKKLLDLGFKIVFCRFGEDETILAARIADRLKLYPHYERILQAPAWYIGQQQEYVEEIKKTALPTLTIETDHLPDEKYVRQILDWIGE
jgi:hypothetical protein